MLGARAIEVPDELELKKDQLRLPTSGGAAVRGEDMLLESPATDEDSSEGFLARAGRGEGVSRTLLPPSLDVDATGTSNMSRACSCWTAGLGSGDTGLPSNWSQFL